MCWRRWRCFLSWRSCCGRCRERLGRAREGRLTCQDRILKTKVRMRPVRCRTCFNQGGLIMGLGPKRPRRGVFGDSKTQGGTTDPDNLKDKVADFSYQSDALAQLIVDMWTGFHKDLLEAPNKTDYLKRSTNAKAVFAARASILTSPSWSRRTSTTKVLAWQTQVYR